MFIWVMFMGCAIAQCDRRSRTEFAKKLVWENGTSWTESRIALTSERPKVPSVQHSAEPSVVSSTEAEPSVVPTERDLRLIEKKS